LIFIRWDNYHGTETLDKNDWTLRDHPCGHSASPGYSGVAPPSTDQPETDEVASDPPEDSTVDQFSNSRFRISPNFRVEEILSGQQIGSLIAIAFDGLGRCLASRENDPLMRAVDTGTDGKPQRLAVFCDQVKNCQGILPWVMTFMSQARAPGARAVSTERRNGRRLS